MEYLMADETRGVANGGATVKEEFLRRAVGRTYTCEIVERSPRPGLFATDSVSGYELRATGSGETRAAAFDAAVRERGELMVRLAE